MNEIHLALAVVGAMVACLTLVLRIMNANNKDIIARIDFLDRKVDQRHAENKEQIEKTNRFRHDIRELVSTRPEYDWIESHYAKKEVVSIELEHLKEAITEMDKKIDILVERKNNAN